MEFLYLFVDYIVKSPFAITWAIPEFYGIIAIFTEEFSEFTGN